MPIPDYQTIMLPFLKYVSDGKIHKSREIIAHIIKKFGLTDEEQKALLPSGTKVINDRVGWAKTYLKNAGLAGKPEKSWVIVETEALMV